jgi:hypothetical protein
MQTETVIERRKAQLALLEVGAFLLLLLGYIWVWQGAFPGSLAAVIAGALLLIAASNFIIHRDRPRALGLRVDNLLASLVEVGAASALIFALLAGGGWVLGTQRPVGPWTIDRLAWLFFWAFIQQYALQAFVQTRLREVWGSDQAAAASAAGLFAFLHLPNPPLMVATFVIGYVWCRLFRRHPNLLTLALSHMTLAITLSHSFPRAWLHGLRVGPGYFNF